MDTKRFRPLYLTSANLKAGNPGFFCFVRIKIYHISSEKTKETKKGVYHEKPKRILLRTWKKYFLRI